MDTKEIIQELKEIIKPQMRGYWVGKVANLIGIISQLVPTQQISEVKIELENALALRDIYVGTRNSGQWKMHINRAIWILNG